MENTTTQKPTQKELFELFGTLKGTVIDDELIKEMAATFEFLFEAFGAATQDKDKS